MTIFAYLRDNAVVHLSTNGNEPLFHTAVVEVPDGAAVEIGYRFDENGEFFKQKYEEEVLPPLTPMTLYLAFKPAERIAIKASTKPMVQEFWAMYQLSVQLDKPTDPNLKSVKDALAYLAQPETATPPGAGILESADRIEEIRRGIAQ